MRAFKVIETINEETVTTFIDVVKRTVDSMFPITATLTDHRREHCREAPYDVSAIIGISGSVRGSMVISFPMDVAKKLAGWMLSVQDDSTLTTQDVSDCAGEVANIIAGNAMPQLFKNNADDQSFSLPSVVVGSHRVVWNSKEPPCELMLFATEVGAFAAEINLRNV
jgi:chemotaxis protein CheX